jgi:hypothetical protein
MLLTALLSLAFLIVGWFGLCYLSIRFLAGRSGGIELAEKASRAAMYLKFFDSQGKEVPVNRVGVFLLSPLYAAILYGGNDSGVEKMQAREKELTGRMNEVRSLRWQNGKVWVHPQEQGMWRARYQEWYLVEVQPKRVKAQEAAQRHRLVSKAMRTMNATKFCACADPVRDRNKDTENAKFCTEGHVLPVNALEMLQ